VVKHGIGAMLMLSMYASMVTIIVTAPYGKSIPTNRDAQSEPGVNTPGSNFS